MHTCSVYVLALLASAAVVDAPGRADHRVEPQLPRFTEEREAAARFFVKKQLPELMPLLDELKKNNVPRYQQEIREIFQTTEMLADLHDHPKRLDVELRIWKAENRALIILTRLGNPTDEDRKKAQEQLRELARELVQFDMQVLEIQVEQLEREIGDVKAELLRSRDHVDENIKARYESLMDKVRRPKK